MPLLEEKVYTIDDIYALPEGERAELIDGHIYYMAPPNRTHQKISMELSARILEYIRSHKGKCEVYAAPFAVYLDDTTSTCLLYTSQQTVSRMITRWQTHPTTVCT